MSFECPNELIISTNSDANFKVIYQIIVFRFFLKSWPSIDRKTFARKTTLKLTIVGNAPPTVVQASKQHK